MPGNEKRRRVARRTRNIGDVAERRASAHPQHHTHTTHSHKGNTMSDWFEEDGNDAERKAPPRKRKQDGEGRIEASDADTGGFFDAEAEETEEVEASEDGGEEDGGMAEIEGDSRRDAFYDGMDAVGGKVGTIGAIAGGFAGGGKGAAIGGAVGGAIQVGAHVGKEMGKLLDAGADADDEIAHLKHQKGDMKRIQDKKDEEALKKINKGMKPGTGVTK